MSDEPTYDSLHVALNLQLDLVQSTREGAVDQPTTSERISELHVAVDHALGAVELVGSLRPLARDGKRLELVSETLRREIVDMMLEVGELQAAALAEGERVERAGKDRDNWRDAYYAAKHSYQSYVARLEAILERDEVKATERIPERITSEPHEPEEPS